MKPQHQHDCNNCVFLGLHEHEGTTYDLYYCPAQFMPIVIARYGTEGDYHSGMIFAEKGLTSAARWSFACVACYQPLAEALRRAKEKALL